MVAEGWHCKTQTYRSVEPWRFMGPLSLWEKPADSTSETKRAFLKDYLLHTILHTAAWHTWVQRCKCVWKLNYHNPWVFPQCAQLTIIGFTCTCFAKDQFLYSATEVPRMAKIPRCRSCSSPNIKDRVHPHQLFNYSLWPRPQVWFLCSWYWETPLFIILWVRIWLSMPCDGLVCTVGHPLCF